MKANLQLPHTKVITNNWGNQFLDKCPYSWNSGSRDINKNPLVCRKF